MKLPVRIVVDTNVLVSALLKRDGPPGQILNLIISGEIRPVFDERIMQEYALVLARPRLRIASANARQVLDFLSIVGERVQPKQLDPTPKEILDLDDLRFAEVAVVSNAFAVVTGNQRHFMFLKQFGALVMSPAEFLDWLASNTDELTP